MTCSSSHVVMHALPQSSMSWFLAKIEVELMKTVCVTYGNVPTCSCQECRIPYQLSFLKNKHCREQSSELNSNKAAVYEACGL